MCAERYSVLLLVPTSNNVYVCVCVRTGSGYIRRKRLPIRVSTLAMMLTTATSGRQRNAINLAKLSRVYVFQFAKKEMDVNRTASGNNTVQNCVYENRPNLFVRFFAISPSCPSAAQVYYLIISFSVSPSFAECASILLILPRPILPLVRFIIRIQQKKKEIKFIVYYVRRWVLGFPMLRGNAAPPRLGHKFSRVNGFFFYCSSSHFAFRASGTFYSGPATDYTKDWNML